MNTDDDETALDTDTEHDPGASDTKTGSEADEGDTAATGAAEADDPADAESISDDEQTWAVLLHASGLLGLAVPFGNVAGPLLVWLIKRDESDFIDQSGKDVLNFQLTWTGLVILSALSLLVGLGFLLLPIVALAWLVLVVIGTIRASERERYAYPLTIDLID